MSSGAGDGFGERPRAAMRYQETERAASVGGVGWRPTNADIINAVAEIRTGENGLVSAIRDMARMAHEHGEQKGVAAVPVGATTATEFGGKVPSWFVLAGDVARKRPLSDWAM